MRKKDKDGVKKYRVSYISGAAQRAVLVFLLLCMGFFAAVTVLKNGIGLGCMCTNSRGMNLLTTA